MTAVSVRYIVDDVDAAIAFYTERLGFTVELQPAPGFAMLSRGDLRLLVNASADRVVPPSPCPTVAGPKPPPPVGDGVDTVASAVVVRPSSQATGMRPRRLRPAPTTRSVFAGLPLPTRRHRPRDPLVPALRAVVPRR
jgi:hypothetical protein